MKWILGFLLCLPLTLSLADEIGLAELPNGAKYIADQIIVVNECDVPAYITGQSQDGVAVTGVPSVDELCCRIGVIKVEPLYPGRLRKPELIREVSRMYIFTLADGIDPQSELSELTGDPNIAFADLYVVPELCYEPNDPQIGDQWHLAKTHVYEGWDMVRGDTTRHGVIGIVDTGIYWDHPDLAANIWVNPGEDLDHNGVFDSTDINYADDDSNGFVDDIIGWDFGNNDNNPIEPSPTHGTAVAGCASEVTDNGIGGAGIGFSARIMAVKAVRDDNPAYLINVFVGLIYAADNGADVINCSWGSPQYNPSFQFLIYSLDCLIVAAASRNDSLPIYPAAYDSVTAVTATDQNDHLSSFGAYGDWIDICAPGVDIYSTWGHSSMTTLDGTSFAAPQVCGMAALVRSWNPEMTVAQVESTIEASADNIDSLNPGYEGLLGAGRLNCYNWLRTDRTFDNPQAPKAFALHSNYPNPFNAQTVISYNLPEPSEVSLDVYDLLGRKIASLISERQQAGEHSIIWDAKNRSSGIYYYRLKAGDLAQSRRCLLLK
jgi:serine protease